MSKAYLAVASLIVLVTLGGSCGAAANETTPAPAASATGRTTIEVPLDQALKEIKGAGKRRLIVFEDPYCPYCRQLEMTLQHVDNVTIYVFLYPILTADSVVKAKSIWCSADRTAAWREWMLERRAPLATGACATPIASVLDFGKRLRVGGTPTMLFADGRRVAGVIPAEEIERYLTEAEKR